MHGKGKLHWVNILRKKVWELAEDSLRKLQITAVTLKRFFPEKGRHMDMCVLKKVENLRTWRTNSPSRWDDTNPFIIQYCTCLELKLQTSVKVRLLMYSHATASLSFRCSLCRALMSSLKSKIRGDAKHLIWQSLWASGLWGLLHVLGYFGRSSEATSTIDTCSHTISSMTSIIQ